jgi:hypothetical protein
MKQINNLQIRHRRYDKPSFYYVRTPNKRVLEEFGTFGKAVRFCQETKDFIKNK